MDYPFLRGDPLIVWGELPVSPYLILNTNKNKVIGSLDKVIIFFIMDICKPRKD